MHHVKSPKLENIWREEWHGLTKRRWIAVGTVLDVGLSSAFAYLEIYPAAIIVGTMITCLLCVFIWRRRILLSQFYSDEKLHNLFHFARTDYVRGITNGDFDDPVKIKAFFCQVTEKIALYFQALLDDKHVGCVIRWAVGSGEQKRYSTIARSSNLDPRRDDHSQDIPHDSGLALQLREGKFRGVIEVDDIAVESQEPYWPETESDDFEDIRAFRLAPINGYVDGVKCMVGMLYVTANTHRVFRLRHVWCIMAIADYLGTLMPFLTYLGIPTGVEPWKSVKPAQSART